MKFNLSKIEFSRKDIKNKIIIPNKLTKKLAYFIGIHLGDGSMYLNKQRGDYLFDYSGHIIDEYDWYTKDIFLLINRLFNKKIKSRKCIRPNSQYINLYFRSKAILTFLNSVIGLPCGSKKVASIPNCIKNSNLNIKSSFIKGLFDTDGCLTFKKRDKNLHYYPVINFSSCSKKLVQDLCFLLNQFRFNFFKVLDYPTERKGTKLKISRIDINGVNALNLWISKIGFNSPKHLTKYLVWKKYGFCPPYTNLLQRKAVLNGRLDINKLQSTFS